MLWVRNGFYFDPRIGAPRPGGVFVQGGRITHVGEDHRLAREVPRSGVMVIDMRGGLVVPGLHDAHCHISEGGLSLLEVDCRGVRSPQELAERAAARARMSPHGEWVTGRGWDDRAFIDPKLPTRADLDQACPHHPVLLRRVDGHGAIANSLALRLTSILKETPNPEGGVIDRDVHGEPTGLLFETAIDRVRALIPLPSPEARKEGIRRVLALAKRFGLTSVEDEKGWPELFVELSECGELTARVRVWNRLEAPLAALLDWRAAFPRSDYLRPGLLKGYLNGSLGSRTAWFTEPYSDAPSNTGVSVIPTDRLNVLVCAADRAQFQVGLHAIGDRAVTQALDAFSAARVANGPDGPPHRIEHAQHVTRRDVSRFAATRTVASMQPSHLSSDFGMVEPRLGRERLSGSYAWRALRESGAEVAFGSDFPIESLDPRTSLYAAVTRRNWDGSGLLQPAKEALTLAEALDHFTRGSAIAAGQESEKGDLSPGKFGDLTVFEHDLFSIDRREILTTPIRATIVGGTIVYGKPS